MNTLSIRRLAAYVLTTECLCKGAIVPYEDGSRGCPHDLAKKVLLEPVEAPQVDTVMSTCDISCPHCGKLVEISGQGRGGGG